MKLLKFYKYKFTKELLDIIFAFLFLIMLLPIFILIAIFIKFSSRGPIFYSHKRIGRNKKIFNCLKFRTMHPEAEDILKNLLEKNNSIREEYEKSHKIKNDPRITIFGKFLRKTSLDELPQFFNVLRREMSIVGPRPIIGEEVNKYGEHFDKVISIKPGITGLWQVSGRNNLSYEKRINLDLIYSKNYNFLMDFRILVRTLGVILFPLDRGAY